MKTRILIVADSAISASSIAECTRGLFSALLSHYPDLYVLAQIGLRHTVAVTPPLWPIYPVTLENENAANSPFEHTSFTQILEKLRINFQPDIIFAFADPRYLGDLCKYCREAHIRLILYLKADGFPLSKELAQRLSNAESLIAPSQFARHAVIEGLIRNQTRTVKCIQPSVDLINYAPLPQREKVKLRSCLFPQGLSKQTFILGWVGRNRWRKQIWLLYRTIHFLRSGKYLVCSDCRGIRTLDWNLINRPCHPGADVVVESTSDQSEWYCTDCGSRRMHRAKPLNDIVLWMHIPEDDPSETWSCRWLEYTYGVTRNEDVYYTEGYTLGNALAPDGLAALYQIWDCLMLTSGSEGLGLTALEAMASGLPVVYTDYSAHSEFLTSAGAGLPVHGIFQPEKKTGHWHMIADISQMIKAVRQLYFDRDLCKTLGRAGRTYMKKHSYTSQLPHWHALFQREHFSRQP